jgi:cytochrome c oxidase subunit 3
MNEAAFESQFDSAEQQRDTATLGMWVFLATEVMFFGGLFMAYTFARWSQPAVVEKASTHLELVLGTINTAVLLTSSFIMAAGVLYAEEARFRRSAAMLFMAAACGVAFLVIKATEYSHVMHEGLFPGSRFHPPEGTGLSAELFFWLYFVMTGLHALHVLIGVVLLTIVGCLLMRRKGASSNLVRNTGLYWHFVDMVWVFLFPLLYLAGHW